ncbi:MAG: VWA domain-containing protein [Candidatus Latescibacteria bacterium]|jgi:Ca-activated chloride channel homolog|nr:VWA domain-containing protein [Candidatus Latescibacterota bacterium]
MIRFASPLFLVLLSFIPLMVWYYVRASRQKRGSLRFPDLGVISNLAPSAAVKYRRILPVIRILAVLIGVIALARPQSGLTGEEVISEGIDIILTLDISGSMRAEDFKPQNRLYVAKQVITEFIKGRTTDRIGLVVFGGQSFTQCPLTLDYNVLTGLMDDIKIGMVDEGTAIGMGIANSVNRLRQSDAESKVVILLTDGVNNTGAIDPLTAARAAKAMGIKVYTVGVGKEGGAPIPVDHPMFGRTYARGSDGSLLLTEIDEGALQEIARITDGDYFRATNAAALSAIYKQIDALERTEIETIQYTRYTELFLYFLIPALVLLLLETVLAQTRFRTLP